MSQAEFRPSQGDRCVRAAHGVAGQCFAAVDAQLVDDAARHKLVAVGRTDPGVERSIGDSRGRPVHARPRVLELVEAALFGPEDGELTPPDRERRPRVEMAPCELVRLLTAPLCLPAGGSFSSQPGAL